MINARRNINGCSFLAGSEELGLSQVVTHNHPSGAIFSEKLWDGPAPLTGADKNHSSSRF